MSIRLTESHLRQLIRETLLNEVAVSPKLAAEMGIRIETTVSADGARVDAFVTEPSGTTRKVGTLRAEEPIEMIDGPCLGAWSIVESKVEIDGLGPLLYDVMMELIFPHPLMSDRYYVSPSALGVWDYYSDRRGDVKKVQLDNIANYLTPDLKDNCTQASAVTWEKNRWMDTSLSKAYTREDGTTPKIDALVRLGVMQESNSGKTSAR